MITISYKKLFSILSGNLFVVASTFITASILLSKSGLESYGYFVTLQSILVALTVLCKPSTWVAVVSFRNQVNLYKLAFISLVLEFLFSSFVLAIIFITGNIFEYKYLSFIINNIALVFLFVFVFNSGALLGVLRAKEKYGAVSLFISFGAAVKLYLVATNYHDIQVLLRYIIICEVILWGSAILLVLLLLFFSNKSNKSNKISENNFSYRQFLRTSFTSSISQIFDLPVNQLDRVIVAFAAGEQAAAVFNLLRRLSSLLNQIAEPFYQLYIAEFSKKDFSYKEFSIFKMTFYSMRKVGLPILISLLTYPFVIKYLDSVFLSNALEGHYLTLFMFLVVTAISIIFIWLNPLYYLHVSQIGTVWITFLSNSFYALSVYIVFSIYSVFFSFLCLLVHVFISYGLKLLGLYSNRSV